MSVLARQAACLLVLLACGHAIGSEVRTVHPLVWLIGAIPVVLVAGYVMIVLAWRFVKNAFKAFRNKRSHDRL